jgi:hypothetical protein
MNTSKQVSISTRAVLFPLALLVSIVQRLQVLTEEKAHEHTQATGSDATKKRLSASATSEWADYLPNGTRILV